MVWPAPLDRPTRACWSHSHLRRALRGSTINAACQFNEEGDKGSIDVGKLADLILLDRKLDPADLKDLRVIETVKEGETIFRAARPN